LALLILIFEPFWKEEKRNAGWLTAGGMLIAMIVSLLFGRPGEPVAVLGGMIRFDWLGFFFKMLFMFAAAATALLLMDHERAGKRGEAYLLLLASLLGMNLMAVSSDLVMLYLAIETASIPLYILSWFPAQRRALDRSGFQVLAVGAMASTIMLYGFSLLFGFSGTTDLYAIAAAFTSGSISRCLPLVC
jgi:NADH-quinone oxidoreductase subunit N